MSSTQAVYYRAPDGSEPVDEFIDRLDERKQPTIDLQIDRLNDRPTSAPPASSLRPTSPSPSSAGPTSSEGWTPPGAGHLVLQATTPHSLISQ
jgi:hypothetical protein